MTDPYKPPPAGPRTPPSGRTAAPGAPGWPPPDDAPARRPDPERATPSEWRRTILRIVAMLAVLVLAAVAVSMTTWDAEGASRIILGAMAAVLVILRGPRAGAPPAVAVFLAAELLAQTARALAAFGVIS